MKTEIEIATGMDSKVWVGQLKFKVMMAEAHIRREDLDLVAKESTVNSNLSENDNKMIAVMTLTYA